MDLTANGGTIAVADITTSGGAGPSQAGGNAGRSRYRRPAGAIALTLNGNLTATGGKGTCRAGNGNTVEPELAQATWYWRVTDIAVDTRGGNTGAGARVEVAGQ